MKAETHSHVIKKMPNQLQRLRDCGNHAHNSWFYPVITNHVNKRVRKGLPARHNYLNQ